MTRNDDSAEKRRPYHKPQVQRVELVPREAVLGACKGFDLTGPGDLQELVHCGLPYDACVLEAPS